MKHSLLRIFACLLGAGLALAGAHGALAPAAAPGLAVEVDVARERVPISPFLYGVNVASWAPTHYLDRVAPLLREAGVTVVRLGATNFERYDPVTNRLFNVIARENQAVPLSWESFVAWVRNDLGAEPFLQASVFGQVAGEGAAEGDPGYSRTQTLAEVTAWAAAAGPAVRFWGVGNEPWIAWKRGDYPGIFADAAHGDQVTNADTSYDAYFARFAAVAGAIKAANPQARILGPTPANWWLYWSNEYSPLCPVTERGGPALPGHPGWAAMLDPGNLWNRAVFPDRGDDPAVTGWEEDPRRALPQYLQRMAAHEAATGRRLADYLDVHRYVRAQSERDAVQEPRGLWEPGFASRDLEVVPWGTETRVLGRLLEAVRRYYPGTQLSLSEYDYFYWEGYPKRPQAAAVGLFDALGYFARAGVGLACNWYVGEPNQSGEDSLRVLDSARQALFDEGGRPNPKYWAFRLMSELFRGTAVRAAASDPEALSAHAAQRDDGDVVVVVSYKGEYDPATGDLVAGLPARTARLQGLPEGLGLYRAVRFGTGDPGLVELDPAAFAVVGGRLDVALEPLAVYAFVFSTRPPQVGARPPVRVTPSRLDFGPYDTQRHLAVTNPGPTPAPWSVSAEAPWLTVAGPAAGAARGTDLLALAADRRGLSYGTHDGVAAVSTPTGTATVPVRLEVVPGEADGEKRFADFETGSLAHTWNVHEPYAVGWWDGHGTPYDRNAPYLYRLALDPTETSRLGGTASLRVEFDRRNGDEANGRRNLAFGTYGHRTVTHTPAGAVDRVHDAAGDWRGYDAFAFDVKAATDGGGPTELLVVIGDEAGRRGKPALGADFRAPLRLSPRVWQTVEIPLGGAGAFWNWRFPEGQDGSAAGLDLGRVRQLEFTPWPGSDTASGVLYLDNLRLVRAGADGNRVPWARAVADRAVVLPGQRVRLEGGGSRDPDGALASYRWTPAAHLTAAAGAAVEFVAPGVGTYRVDLVVTDDRGRANRNVAQVEIEVRATLPPAPGEDDPTRRRETSCFLGALGAGPTSAGAPPPR